MHRNRGGEYERENKSDNLTVLHMPEHDKIISVSWQMKNYECKKLKKGRGISSLTLKTDPCVNVKHVVLRCKKENYELYIWNRDNFRSV